MATSPAALITPQRIEDPLAHLTCSDVLEYKKDKVIYGPEQPSTSLYLIVGGR